MTNFENLDPTGNNRNTASSNAKSSKSTAVIIAVLVFAIGALVLLFSDWGTTNSQVSQTTASDGVASVGQESPPAAPTPVAPATNP